MKNMLFSTSRLNPSANSSKPGEEQWVLQDRHIVAHRGWASRTKGDTMMTSAPTQANASATQASQAGRDAGSGSQDAAKGEAPDQYRQVDMHHQRRVKKSIQGYAPTRRACRTPPAARKIRPPRAAPAHTTRASPVPAGAANPAAPPGCNLYRASL